MDSLTTNPLRRPNTFWQLAFDDDARDVRDIAGRDFCSEQLNYLCLKRGVPFAGALPPEVRLRLTPGPAPISDYPANIMGWPIVSERLLNHLFPLISSCVQVISAPIYEQNSNERIEGYSIINVTKVVDCLIREKSVPWYDGREISGFYELCIDPGKTEGAHMFKCLVAPGEVDFRVICSYDLVSSLQGKGFKGLAFIRCPSPDDLADG